VELPTLLPHLFNNRKVLGGASRTHRATLTLPFLGETRVQIAVESKPAERTAEDSVFQSSIVLFALPLEC